ncbi:hypothetical protein BZA05DRAFT_420225 [Tricharina praecox]|uniref:uncharacterized protein n=1 Tax=Tricharina praecox TaxID=43433 RepID=UPI00221F3F54|nr:uncharacterized protein BZA05DRAFT_420225 [Tricharina praecox]KAI5848335.1 hypothetical protein BZA05DRAFT_420225 [Tricharina praecox]
MVRPSVLAGTDMRIAVIERGSIHHDPGCDISQREAEVLTSYDILPNWRNTIVVPGCPPIWSPPPLPIRIPADEDQDPSHQRPPARLNFPTYPLGPLIPALPIIRPTLSLRSFDTVPGAAPTGVRKVPGGVLVPEESIVKLKSRPKGKTYIKQAEQLWFSRTPILTIGYHEDGGNIVEVEQRDVEKTRWLKK